VSRRRAIAAWHWAVHRAIHPISAALVLSAAGVEVFEWVQVGLEHFAQLIHG
jgi:hypothetical protein